MFLSLEVVSCSTFRWKGCHGCIEQLWNLHGISIVTDNKELRLLAKSGPYAELQASEVDQDNSQRARIREDKPISEEILKFSERHSPAREGS
jgi:hypothetical protein